MLKLLAILLAIPAIAQATELFRYGTANAPAPVLSTPDFRIIHPAGGKAPRTDRCGQVRQLEFIALPGTAFTILGTADAAPDLIFRVETADYKAAPGKNLYIEARFIEPSTGEPPARQRSMPDRETIIRFLLSSVGLPYVWGGNYRAGVSYPGTETLPLFAGLDCSGILYEATGGATPRNTSELVNFGRAVAIAGRSADQISKLLQPLDLIVWDGHVIIVLEQGKCIESRLECGKRGNGGVTVSPLKKRLQELLAVRQPSDSWDRPRKGRNTFVVRRWME